MNAVLNNVADVLGVVLTGTLGRSGRKRARRATNFLTGHRGFLSASTLMAAAGVAWGIYDTMKNKDQGTAMVPGVPTVPGVPQGEVLTGSAFAIPPIPQAFADAIDPVVRIVRLAVSAAKADGVLNDQ